MAAGGCRCLQVSGVGNMAPLSSLVACSSPAPSKLHMALCKIMKWTLRQGMLHMKALAVASGYR